jgi:hypothetical protein
VLFFYGDKMTKEEKKLIKARYTQQLCAARKRKIEWLFTFETWWKMWDESGKWSQRGRKSNQYCMARKGDVGPYSPENVNIVTCATNNNEAHSGKTGYWTGKKMSAERIEQMRIASTGVKQSEETCLKKSLANKGKPWSEARRAAYLARIKPY